MERLPGVTIGSDFADITPDELVTHTPRLPPNRVDVGEIMQPDSRVALYAALSDAPVKRVEPGRTYPNWGHALLGHIVENEWVGMLAS